MEEGREGPSTILRGEGGGEDEREECGQLIDGLRGLRRRWIGAGGFPGSPADEVAIGMKEPPWKVGCEDGEIGFAVCGVSIDAKRLGIFEEIPGDTALHEKLVDGGYEGWSGDGPGVGSDGDGGDGVDHGDGALTAVLLDGDTADEEGPVSEEGAIQLFALESGVSEAGSEGREDTGEGDASHRASIGVMFIDFIDDIIAEDGAGLGDSGQCRPFAFDA